MLTFNLKKVWYEKIRSGEKRIEYREVKPYWTKRIENELRDNVVFAEDLIQVELFKHGLVVDCANIECVLRLGYTSRRMNAVITKIEVVDGTVTDLRMDKPVYAIHLAQVKEKK